MYSRVPDQDFQLSGYSDSDWATNTDDRRSVSGFCFSFSGGVVSWNSKKQPTVALSSSEAEYLALSSAAQELVFLRYLLRDLGFELDSPSCLRGDNRGSIAMAQNPTGHKRAKHIDIRYHFIRDLVTDGIISIIFTPNDDNLADIFTKNLAKPKFPVA